MTKPYLQVTYRHGKSFAAHLYLDRRSADTAAKSRRRGGFVVDYAADGRVLGVELLQVSSIDLAALNDLIGSSPAGPLKASDLAPLNVA